MWLEITVWSGVLVLSAIQDVSTPRFPWSDYLVKLKGAPSLNLTQKEKDLLKSSNIPEPAWPFVNVSAVEELKLKGNHSEDEIITDEDVADIHDDDPVPNTIKYDGKKTTITVSTDAGQMLFQHWMDQAISGLMATIATKKLETVGDVERSAHKECAKDSTTVKKHAQCVLALIEAEAKYRRWTEKLLRKKAGLQKRKRIVPTRKLIASPRKWKGSLRKWNNVPFLKRRMSIRRIPPKRSYFPSKSDWIGKFRTRPKRSILNSGEMMKVKPVTAERYDLLEHKNSPMAIIAKNILRDVRKSKNKDADNFDDIKKMNIFGDDDEDDDEKLEKFMKKANKAAMKMTDEEKLMQAPVNIVREGVKLGMMLGGQNTSDFDEKNLKIASPRLLPLLPDEDDDGSVNLLSPSLFALHKEGYGIEAETSLSKMTSIFGERESDAWLNLIMEASGVSDSLAQLKEANNDHDKRLRDDVRGIDGQPLYFTKNNVTEMFGEEGRRKVELFERLQHSFSEEQLRMINTTGYVVMSEQQMDMVYGRGAPFEDPIVRERLSNVSKKDVDVAIEKTIRGLAAETIRFETQRRKAIVLAPILLGSIILDAAGASEPLILSPALLTPVILSPAIFGCVILSPWAFVPVILGPRLLSPVVLSPILFSPVILSPLVLDPLVLSPGVGAPFILTPLVLSPFILSPVALGPLILCPFALSPFIGIPHTLSPLILSPFVLSPILYSPPFISAFVLTPHALSPIIHSEGKHFHSILSPSWLS
ncbi:hypothetical protein Q1695_008797 [Nippostrongylus brasiliensis]|nr:hypothetical protein Q1695_008797 [Nippostrongylus brasiliensis]